MSVHNYPQTDYYRELSEGRLSGVSVIHKFGRNSAVGTSFVPVCIGGVYRTPQAAGATTLRVKAGDANDTAAGTGARTVYIEGVNAAGNLTSEILTTNGATAGTASSNSYIRLYRAYVATSGTYGSATAGSHAASLVIENSAGTENWATLDATDFPRSQTEIGVYTVPTGHVAYIKEIYVHVESLKPATIILFQRDNILQTVAPYSAIRARLTAVGVEGELVLDSESLIGPMNANTDIGFMAKVASGTAAVSVDFNIILKAN